MPVVTIDWNVLEVVESFVYLDAPWVLLGMWVVRQIATYLKLGWYLQN